MFRESREWKTSLAAILAASLLTGCLDLGGGSSSTVSNAISPPPPPPPPPAANSAPTISGIPTTLVMVGNSWAFTPNATDADNDPLSFSIQNQPSWTNFDTANGTLSGVPQLGQEGDYPDIVISVSDGSESASLTPFTMQVRNNSSNTPPQISGTPSGTAVVGQVYDFIPDASDAENDPLTFMISGMPPWASFDQSTGQLTGNPEPMHVGVYDNILISVSDGDLMTALPAFSITVTAAASGSVTLTWTPPTTNTDGSPLQDLVAYKFYYGLSEGNYPNEIRVDNPGLTSYVIDNLAPNTYFFVTSVINSNQVESGFSNVSSATVSAN